MKPAFFVIVLLIIRVLWEYVDKVIFTVSSWYRWMSDSSNNSVFLQTIANVKRNRRPGDEIWSEKIC